MENFKGRYVELLHEKRNALDCMRQATKQQVFTGDESLVKQEAEAFIALYEQRSEVLARVEKIDDALELLDPLDEKDLEDTSFQVRVVELRQKMVELAREMVSLDKKNMAVYEKISAYVKNDMRQARQGQDLLQGYDDYVDTNEGHFVDKKKI